VAAGYLYRVGFRSTASVATINTVAFSVWNPHATARVRLTEFKCFVPTAAAVNGAIRRISARGTASATQTPLIGNEDGRMIAPPSGFVVDTAWSVAPTLDASSVNAEQFYIGAVAGSGVILVFGSEGITLPPGAGIGFLTTQAAAFPACDVTLVVQEG
jgi:hypothetical protein